MTCASIHMSRGVVPTVPVYIAVQCACEEKFNLLEGRGWHDKFATICKPGHKEYVTLAGGNDHSISQLKHASSNSSHLIYLQPTRWLAHQKQEKLASSQGSGIRNQKSGYKDMVTKSPEPKMPIMVYGFKGVGSNELATNC
jgi:hypothetical protein